MKTYDPNTFAPKLDTTHRQWIQSTQTVVNGGIEIGTPSVNSPSATTGVNKGVPTQYNRANGSGVMIRIDATGDTNGATYNWAGNGVGVPIKHALNRVPIGFHVVDQDGVITVYRTAPPTSELITLAPSDATKSVTVYIF